MRAGRRWLGAIHPYIQTRLNRALKHFAERALVRSGAPVVGRRRLRQRTLVLAYHNVLPESARIAGDRSLHLPKREFARQLDHLRRYYEVISLDQLAGPSLPSEGKPRIVITFDDAYAGALASGIEELVKRALPATVFVAPGLLGTVAWWDVLAERSGGELPTGVRHNALTALNGRAEAVLDAYVPGGESPRSASLPRIGSEADLKRAAAQPGITLGSHTWSHPNLSSLKDSEVELELSRPLEWLRARFTRTVPWVTYPYGLSSPGVATAVKRLGYAGAFRIEGGWIPTAPHSTYSLPRFNIPSGLSIDGFRLRLAGL